MSPEAFAQRSTLIAQRCSLGLHTVEGLVGTDEQSIARDSGGAVELAVIGGELVLGEGLELGAGLPDMSQSGTGDENELVAHEDR